MRKHLTLGLLSVLHVGCLSERDEPTATQIFETPAPSRAVFSTPPPDVSGPLMGPVSGPNGPPNGGGYNEGLVESGHLEGRLQNVVLDHDTTQNDSFLDLWNENDEYLGINVAAMGSGGAGMIMLGLPGGLDHEVFVDGRWSSAEAGAVTTDPSEEYVEQTWVGSCSGPALGNFPDEQDAVAYEMTAEPDPNDPDIQILVVAASFNSALTTDVTATIRLDTTALSR